VILGDVCIVRWTDARDIRPGDEELLTDDERRRVDRVLHPGERGLRIAASVLIRRVAGDFSGLDPREVRIDRTCSRCGAPHGRPTLPGLDIQASITHAGHIAGIAVCRASFVGLDVEQTTRCTFPGLGRHALGPGERAMSAYELCRYWTRKEALVKATGDGIAIGLRNVRVSGPDEPPRLVSYRGRPDLRAALTDLPVRRGYRACVAILTAEPVTVEAGWYRAPARPLPAGRR
jgi:4'-phosphopantetheinyl transferase